MLAMRPVDACYYVPRDDEFCALITQPTDDVRSVLVAALGALNEVGEPSLITAFFGAMFVPVEAADPIEALMIADERLGLGLLSGKTRGGDRSLVPFEAALCCPIKSGLASIFRMSHGVADR